MVLIVMGKFGGRKQWSPVGLMVADEVTQVLFNSFVGDFGLAVGLGVECC